MSDPIHLQELKEEVRAGRADLAFVRRINVIFEDFENNKKKLLSSDFLRDFRLQLVEIKKDDNLSEDVRKMANAYIEALFEVEKFQRGLSGKREGTSATRQQLYRVLEKKFNRANLGLKAYLEKIGKSQALDKDGQKVLTYLEKMNLATLKEIIPKVIAKIKDSNVRKRLTKIFEASPELPTEAIPELSAKDNETLLRLFGLGIWVVLLLLDVIMYGGPMGVQYWTTLVAAYLLGMQYLGPVMKKEN